MKGVFPHFLGNTFPLWEFGTCFLGRKLFRRKLFWGISPLDFLIGGPIIIHAWVEKICGMLFFGKHTSRVWRSLWNFFSRRREDSLKFFLESLGKIPLLGVCRAPFFYGEPHYMKKGSRGQKIWGGGFKHTVYCSRCSRRNIRETGGEDRRFVV